METWAAIFQLKLKLLKLSAVQNKAWSIYLTIKRCETWLQRWSQMRSTKMEKAKYKPPWSLLLSLCRERSTPGGWGKESDIDIPTLAPTARFPKKALGHACQRSVWTQATSWQIPGLRFTIECFDDTGKSIIHKLNLYHPHNDWCDGACMCIHCWDGKSPSAPSSFASETVETKSHYLNALKIQNILPKKDTKDTSALPPSWNNVFCNCNADRIK